MDHFQNQKQELPVVYVDNGFSPSHKTKGQRVYSAIAKALLFAVFTGLCLALAYQVVHFQQDYDSLLAKYNTLLGQNHGFLSDTPPAVSLFRRGMSVDNVSYTSTTTTLTEGVTITIRTTASPTFPTATFLSPVLPTTSAALTGCGPSIPPETVTVTVTASPTQAEPTDLTSVTVTTTLAPSSSPTPTSYPLFTTVVATRFTTTTIYVTSSGLVSPKLETLTVVATATVLQTSTDVLTVDSDGTLIPGATATSTAVGVFDTDTPSTLAGFATARTTSYGHYPNGTSSVGLYNSTAHGGDVALSTASFTLTVPARETSTGAVGGSAGIAATRGTITGQHPFATVTVSEAHKNRGVFPAALVAVILAAVVHF
ncbi:hypothetical protein SPI_08248 [Niveomyces insectorum RCEF 264]|uniref:Uncharacterized protein n=1 Tax=Niveomyces insectorum RCEF 264 TaxID=1081102 RepID=A0A167NHJ3_9HYPO|nr:hypothetical protein SPI_08248 [Niveomyces insectorum RCEF 264]